MRLIKKWFCVFFCVFCVLGFSSCDSIFPTGNGNLALPEWGLKLNDTRQCADCSIKFMDNSKYSSCIYYVTPTGFEMNKLSEKGYTMKISVTYDVYYKKDYDVLWDIGYAGSPKYEVFLLNDDGLGSMQKNLTTKTQSMTRTITYISTATDLLNTKIKLTFSTDNIQNIIYFKNIVVTYVCYK